MTMNYYSENAPILASKYNSLNPESLHASWSRFIPDDPGIALDIGAGTGRDANWLADKGWDVVALEPCKEFREQNQHNSHDNVIWLDDELPELKKLRTAGHRFNLILLSAVWMHVLPKKRERAFRIISELLAPGGILVFTLRQGTDEQENLDRGFHPVSSGELEKLAKQRALAQVFYERSEDHLDRSKVRWETPGLSIAGRWHGQPAAVAPHHRQRRQNSYLQVGFVACLDTYSGRGAWDGHQTYR